MKKKWKQLRKLLLVATAAYGLFMAGLMVFSFIMIAAMELVAFWQNIDPMLREIILLCGALLAGAGAFSIITREVDEREARHER